jgi:hypothetical protein
MKKCNGILENRITRDQQLSQTKISPIKSEKQKTLDEVRAFTANLNFK